MGIPSFFSHILRNNKEVFVQFNKNVKWLMLDSNSIIYDVVHSIKDEKIKFSMIYQRVCERIEMYMDMFDESTHVFISFDGVVPQAKMEQQRQRRFRSSVEKKLTQKESLFDTLQITPGTKFMDGLDEYVEEYFRGNKRVILSGSKVHGEGEHKICEYIRNNSLTSSKICIYGLDADLIVLALNHMEYVDNIYLCRELPEELVKYKNVTYDECRVFMDIKKYQRIIESYMCDYKSNSNINLRNKVKDYIFLSFLLGNDFLPHFPWLNIRTNGIKTLLVAYKSVIKPHESIVNNKSIVWKNVKKLLKYMLHETESELKNEYAHHERYKMRVRKSTEEDRVLFLPFEFDDDMYQIDVYAKGWEKRYYEVLFGIANDYDKIIRICRNYLEGLEWTFDYYCGNEVSWVWKYDYNYGPLFQDLIKLVPDFGTKICYANIEERPDSQTLLAYVMPKEGLRYLKPDVYEYMIKKYSHIYKEESIQLQMAFTRFFWESKLRIAPVNMLELQKDIKEIELQ
jgi:5'-3' exonuclease